MTAPLLTDTDTVKATWHAQTAAQMREDAADWRAHADAIRQFPGRDLDRYTRDYADGIAARLDLVAVWCEHEAARHEGYSADYDLHAAGLR